MITHHTTFLHGLRHEVEPMQPKAPTLAERYLKVTGLPESAVVFSFHTPSTVHITAAIDLNQVRSARFVGQTQYDMNRLLDFFTTYQLAEAEDGRGSY